MMNIVIIEDEKPAAEKLQKAIMKADAQATIAAMPASIASAVAWLQQHEMPQLIFMDIELTDGLSFKIFEQVNITCPVIFCTAYDEYWQEAFEHNSIDYLLKPIKQDKLEAALGKYEKLKQYFSVNLQHLLKTQKQGNGYKKRFLVKRGTDYISIKTEDIAYFYAAHKLVCMVDAKGQKFILDESLSDMEQELDPSLFYRVNRKYLVQITAIQKIKSFSKGKLMLELQPHTQEEIIVSQENAAAFKEWMGK
jgi:DNA-binding LytR/AlgR family response regulator